MSKWTSQAMMIMLLISFLLASCTSELKPKTVIIPDVEDSSSPNKVNEEFTVNKIYTISDEGEVYEDILGWMDQNQLLGISGKDLSRSFERVDYKFNSHQKIIDVGNSEQIAKLSPDGMHIAYLINGEITSKLMLLDLASKKEAVIQDNVAGSYLLAPITWSNNSQYVSYGTGDEKARDGSFFVYDILNKSTVKYQVPEWNRKEMSFGAKISDDGKNVLLIKIVDGQSNLVYGALKGSLVINKFERPININGTFDYLSVNQILYVSLGGSLSMYDRRNDTLTTLMEPIDTFQLSKDRKYMAYSKDRDEILVSKLQGNNLINEKSIYKGLIPDQMQWSPDDKKILLLGRKIYAAAEAAPAPMLVPNQAGVLPVNLPYILEFK